MSDKQLKERAQDEIYGFIRAMVSAQEEQGADIELVDEMIKQTARIAKLFGYQEP
jgi:hypothetical protein